MTLDQLARVLTGGVMTLIVGLLTFVLWRVRLILPERKPCGVVHALYHILLAGDGFFLLTACVSITGVWLRNHEPYLQIVSIALLAASLWLLIAIIYAMVCIMRELYIDEPRTGTNRRDC